jgi:hypothetical protein
MVTGELSEMDIITKPSVSGIIGKRFYSVLLNCQNLLQRKFCMPRIDDEEIQQYLADGGIRFGNSFEQRLRKDAGLPRFEYSEAYFALQDTEKRSSNQGTLETLGNFGWEILYVAPTKYPGIVSLLCKRRKFFE